MGGVTFGFAGNACWIGVWNKSLSGINKIWGKDLYDPLDIGMWGDEATSGGML